MGSNSANGPGSVAQSLCWMRLGGRDRFKVLSRYREQLNLGVDCGEWCLFDCWMKSGGGSKGKSECWAGEGKKSFFGLPAH